jgi:hypothetical protein
MVEGMLWEGEWWWGWEGRRGAKEDSWTTKFDEGGAALALALSAGRSGW